MLGNKALLLLISLVCLLACSEKASHQSEDGITEAKTPTESSVEKKALIKEIIRELINGPANIRDTINGKVVFSLLNNVLVEAGPVENNWQVVGLEVKRPDRQVDRSKILPGSDLIDLTGNVVGEAIDTVQVWYEEKNSVFIGAYTFKNNIQAKSIVENQLADLINEARMSKKEMDWLLTSFHFQEYPTQDSNIDLPGLKMYAFDESIVVDPSPRDRLTLLFKQNQLAGFFHSRPVKVKNYKTYDLVRGHRFTVTGQLLESEIKEIIEKRIQFYNTTD